MTSRILVTITAITLSAAALAAGESPQYITGARSGDRAALPFSEAVLAGDTLYVAGHIGIDPKTNQAASDPQVEAKLVLDAVQKTVKSAGFAMDDLVSVTVYCTDLELYDAFNRTYQGYFHHGKFPSRAFIGVARLLRGAHFEVQGIAVRRTKAP